jgi:hypothetical protein
VNLGPTINTSSSDNGPAFSKDGLSLYFGSSRPGGFGLMDIWVSQRDSVNDDCGAPVNLGPTINTASGDLLPALSRDGHWMFFTSTRPGGFAPTTSAAWSRRQHGAGGRRRQQRDGIHTIQH